ncbi:MAG: NHL repeat-containing protein [bacterium]
MGRNALTFSVVIAAGLFLGLATSCVDEEEPTASSSGGRLWVIDQPNSFVQVYDYGGEQLFTVGNFPFFMKPNCVEVDRRDGSAWVLDYYANKLRKFDNGGNLIFETAVGGGGEPLVRRATAIAVDQTSGACWVADRSHSRVLKLGASGKVLATVTGFRSPRAVSLVYNTGDCWVADELQDRVVKLRADASGTVSVGGVMLAECGGFDVPWSVAADPGGGVWALDKGAGAVVKVNGAGERVAEVTGFSFPYGAVASRAANSVFVVDYDKGWLAAFTREVVGVHRVDEAAKLFLTGLPYPTDVELDESGGYVFVAASDGVRRYSTAGELLHKYPELTLPVAVAADPAP